MLLATLVLAALPLSKAPLPTGVVSVPVLIAETADKLPDIPAGYQSQFQALVIRQQKAQIDMNTAMQTAQDAQKKLLQVNTEGQILQEKMFKELKLDSTQYTVRLSDNGTLVIAKVPAAKNPDTREEKK